MSATTAALSVALISHAKRLCGSILGDLRCADPDLPRVHEDVTRMYGLLADMQRAFADFPAPDHESVDYDTGEISGPAPDGEAIEVMLYPSPEDREAVHIDTVRATTVGTRAAAQELRITEVQCRSLAQLGLLSAVRTYSAGTRGGAGFRYDRASIALLADALHQEAQ